MWVLSDFSCGERSRLYLVAHPHHSPLTFASSPLLYIHPSYTNNALFFLHSASLPYLALKSTNTQLTVWLQMEPQLTQWEDPSLRELKPRAEGAWHGRRDSWKQVTPVVICHAMPAHFQTALSISHQSSQKLPGYTGNVDFLWSLEPQPLGARSRSVNAALSAHRWS